MSRAPSPSERGGNQSDASCLSGPAGLAVERGVLTGLGVKIRQLVTDDCLVFAQVDT